MVMYILTQVLKMLIDKSVQKHKSEDVSVEWTLTREKPELVECWRWSQIRALRQWGLLLH